MSGLIADSHSMVEKARVEAQNYWFTYNESMTVESTTQAVSNLALRFSDDDEHEDRMSRPFGAALLLAGVDDRGPHLFHLDPTGTFTEYYAKAIGAGSEGAQSSLKEVYTKDMTLLEAEVHAVTILKQIMEEKLNSSNVELASVQCNVPKGEKNFKLYSKETLEEIIAQIKK